VEVGVVGAGCAGLGEGVVAGGELVAAGQLLRVTDGEPGSVASVAPGPGVSS
jgi:hypothetical protein